ncbi:hypothetical protein CF319_g8255 [Tilletia indica]|nr:hypothetical protein CF319_g8255 [Tilletia indica]KAE8229840.1 hypothetical protein CF326_g5180 [Tilletia indica]
MPAIQHLPTEILKAITESCARDVEPSLRSEHPQEALKKRVAHSHELGLVSKRLRTAVAMEQFLRFDTLPAGCDPILRAVCTEWIPTDDGGLPDHISYCLHHFGDSWPKSCSVDFQTHYFDEHPERRPQVIKADLRVPSFNMNEGFRTWQLPELIASGALLSRFMVKNDNLETLHLRISVDDSIVMQIQKILYRNPQLTEVVIESDSYSVIDGASRPVLDLGRMCHPLTTSACLKRFVIRAPSLLLSASAYTNTFFKRISNCTDVCIAVRTVHTAQHTWKWVLQLLRQTPNLKTFELSEAFAWDVDEEVHEDPSAQLSDFVSLPFLKHLTLDTFSVTCTLMQRLQAPLLKYLRIRSQQPVGKNGNCPPNSFPSLLCANVWCPGQVRQRLEALGLGLLQFRHAIPLHLNEHDETDTEVLVYLKPYKHHEEWIGVIS